MVLKVEFSYISVEQDFSILFQAVSGLPDPTGEKERHNSESDSQAANSGSEDTKDQTDTNYSDKELAKSSKNISRQKKSNKKARHR